MLNDENESIKNEKTRKAEYDAPSNTFFPSLEMYSKPKYIVFVGRDSCYHNGFDTFHLGYVTKA